MKKNYIKIPVPIPDEGLKTYLLGICDIYRSCGGSYSLTKTKSETYGYKHQESLILNLIAILVDILFMHIYKYIIFNEFNKRKARIIIKEYAELISAALLWEFDELSKTIYKSKCKTEKQYDPDNPDHERDIKED